MVALDPAKFGCPICHELIPITIAVDMTTVDTAAGKTTARLIADISELKAHIESEHHE